MTHIGIDPGLDGGIAVLMTGCPPEVIAMPTLGTGRRELDVSRIRERIRSFKIWCGGVYVAIERQQSMPKQGIASTFRIGENYGLIVGICVGLGVRYAIVPARAWQKVMLDGVSRKLDTKAASVIVAKRKFPEVSLRPTDRCRKDHHGMSDALLIAAYGQRIG
jgi:hypothetical protein